MPLFDPLTSLIESRRQKKLRTTDQKPAQLDRRLPIDGVVDNLIVTEDRVTAYYVAAAQGWSFRPDHWREGLIRAGAQHWAELTGRRVHVRVTSRPWPVDLWARTHHENAPRPLPGWSEYLQAEQMHLHGAAPADKIAFYGVDVSRRSGMTRQLSRASTVHANKEVTVLDRELERVDRIMAGSGLEATPASADDMQYLLHRSVGLGLPAPLQLRSPSGRFDAEDLAELTDRTHMFAEPYDEGVTVVGINDSGERVDRYVVVLTLGRMGALQIPEVDEPWISRADRLPFPVEWSLVADVCRPEMVVAEMQRQVQRIAYQRDHFAVEHSTNPPLALARQSDHAMRVADELEHGLEGLSTRVHGWVRIAVSGVHKAQALERAGAVRELYQPSIAVVHGFDQYRKAREFIPGVGVATSAYKRRFSVQYLAAAVPAVTATVGDRRGAYLGRSCSSSRRPVMWDPWYAMEVREASGLVPILGGLGAGKSNLLGLIVYKTAMQGVRWVVLDPSGPLAKLCDLPELNGRARHLNLLDGAPGLLSPYLVVPEPAREHYGTEDEYRRELIKAAATRRALARDVLLQLLPPEIARDRRTRRALLLATKAVGGQRGNHLGMVLDQLKRIGEEMADLTEAAGDAAEFLGEIQDLPQMQLIFPPPGEDLLDPSDGGPLVTVMTMRGLTLPQESTAREDYTDDERFHLVLLSLAFWLTHRSIYEGDMHARKGVAMDEAHFLSALSTGRTLANRSARDTRKHNCAALMASQIGDDVLRTGVASLAGAGFVGRTTDGIAQAEGLRLLGVPTGVGYEQVLGGLSPFVTDGSRRAREFVFADGAGGVEKITIDLEGQPDLKDALNTTPVGQPHRPSVVVDATRWERAS